MSDRKPLVGVSACLIRGDDVLLVRRARAPFAGCFSLPGGRVEFGEPLADAVEREVREETGLTGMPLAFRRFHEAIDRAAGIHAVIAVFSGRLAADAIPVAGDDAAEVAFFHPDAITALDAAGRTTPGLARIVQTLLAQPASVAQIPQVSVDPIGSPQMPC